MRSFIASNVKTSYDYPAAKVLIIRTGKETVFNQAWLLMEQPHT